MLWWVFILFGLTACPALSGEPNRTSRASEPAACSASACQTETGSAGDPLQDDYAVVVSEETLDRPAWRKVVDALVARHDARVLSHNGDPGDWERALRATFPKYACFVARPEELGLKTLLAIQWRTRRLDDDPYADVVWGIVTGYRAQDALRIATTDEPLIIRKGLAGNPMDLGPFREGIWFYEGADTAAKQKRADGSIVDFPCTFDNAHRLVQLLNDFQPDYFQASGHANTKRWEIGYGCKRGVLASRDGVLVGVDTKGRPLAVQSPNPKVYLPYRNCLVGLVEDRDSLAVAWLSSAGVNQLAGYCGVTWSGIAGNGMRGWFFDAPGRYTFAESYYFSQAMIIDSLSPRQLAYRPTAGQIREVSLDRIAAELREESATADREQVALVWDRDTFIFYGDPAWSARLEPPAPVPRWTIDVEDGIYRILVTVDRPASVNRYLLLPHRVGNVQFLDGEEHVGKRADNFMSVSGEVDAGTTQLVRFRANRLWPAPPRLTRRPTATPPDNREDANP